jgi:uncharacterized damage-inducible protein DinB
MLDKLRQLFRYDDWANREVLAAFPVPPPPRSLKLLAHIIGTEYCWYSRIKGEKAPIAIWPDLVVDGCRDHISRLSRIWSRDLAGMDEAALRVGVTYKNTKGEPWTNSVEDILTHVIMHSAYHRGQIAADMRASGHTPAYTDFIHAVRQKLLE